MGTRINHARCANRIYKVGLGFAACPAPPVARANGVPVCRIHAEDWPQDSVKILTTDGHR